MSTVHTVYWMCCPSANLMRARRWYAFFCRNRDRLGFDVAADWILWCELLDDANPAERAAGLQFDSEMVRRLDGVVLVGGRISAGMAVEVQIAKEHGKDVLDWTAYGIEPPGPGDRLPV